MQLLSLSVGQVADSKLKLKGKEAAAEPQNSQPPTRNQNIAAAQASNVGIPLAPYEPVGQKDVQRAAESSSKGMDEASVESADEAEDIVSTKDADYDEGRAF